VQLWAATPPAPAAADAPGAVAALEDNIWYYKDRFGMPRGPCTLTTFRKCWVHGVVDQYTLVWGQGLEGWYPMRNVVGLITNLNSLDGAPSLGPKPSIRRRRQAAQAAPHRLARAAWARPRRLAARWSALGRSSRRGAAPELLQRPNPAAADAARSQPSCSSTSTTSSSSSRAWRWSARRCVNAAARSSARAAPDARTHPAPPQRVEAALQAYSGPDPLKELKTDCA